MKPQDSEYAICFRKAALKHSLEIRDLAAAPGFVGFLLKIPQLYQDGNWSDFIRCLQKARRSSNHLRIESVVPVGFDCNLFHRHFESVRLSCPVQDCVGSAHAPILETDGIVLMFTAKRLETS